MSYVVVVTAVGERDRIYGPYEMRAQASGKVAAIALTHPDSGWSLPAKQARVYELEAPEECQP